MEEKTVGQLIEEKRERLKVLLIRLKRVNAVYKVASEEQRGRLIEACQPTFVELGTYGYRKEFLESLLISGNDFLESLGELPDLNLYQLTELIFK